MVRVIVRIAIVSVLASACSSDEHPGPPAGDITPPSRVLDLTVAGTIGSSVTLSWTAPGDDGADGRASAYDLRYSPSSLEGAGWDTAAAAGGLSAPKPAGQAESTTVTDLVSGDWFFALKTADEVPNWSALSNVVGVTVVDTIPPGPVTDLSVVSSSFASLRLSWTAPGNDGLVGRAAEYDLRRALVPITDESWDSAVRAEGLPRPALPGQLRFFTFYGLEPGTSYYLALRSSDGVPNWSALSNVVGRATLSIGTRQLTMSGQPGGAGPTHWSPDGQTILTCADWEGPRGHDQIYLVPAAGGDPVQLTHVPRSVKIRDACWSPDGTQIAFIADPSGYCEIHVMRAMPDAASYPVTHLESPNLGNCVWSPDGSRIAYLDVASSDPVVVWRICIVPADGGSASVLRGANVGSCIAPAWSPDGTRIAFSSDRTGDHEIYVVSAEGGEPVRLTDDPANDTRPAWSPDGDQIAVSSDRTGNSDLWLMSSDGRYPTPITFDPASEGRPSWSPDGHNIAFIRSTSDGISDIWVLEGEEGTR